ncbi:hypothetical protein QO179_25160 [Bacillus stercoris]|nr:hypothetical protein [Bacillus stercoris]
MQFSIGDIVECIDGDYSITKKGTQWIVYSIKDDFMKIGYIPDSFLEFNKNINKHFFLKVIGIKDLFSKLQ